MPDITASPTPTPTLDNVTPVLSSDELSSSLICKIFPSIDGSSNKSSNLVLPLGVGPVLASMATGFGIPAESGSSSFEDDSESVKRSCGSLFSTDVLLILDVGTVLLGIGTVFGGALVNTDVEVTLDGFVVLLLCDGVDLPEEALGGRVIMSSSLSESQLLLFELSPRRAGGGASYKTTSAEYIDITH